jgi:NAD+ kinase
MDHNGVVALSQDVQPDTRSAHQRLGLVVHPSRPIESPVRTLREWTDAHGVELVQVAAPCRQQDVAARGDAAECDLIVSIGGDGTALAALRTGAVAGTPVLGVAYGSLGVLTSVDPDGVARAVDRFQHGDWVAERLPALELRGEQGDELFALNDAVFVRAGEGQVRASADVDGVAFARFAGDGCIVSTPVGSSAYALSANGPLLTPHVRAFLLTLLPTHGGFIPPLVLAGDAELHLEIQAGFGGWRLELDGQIVDAPGESLSLRMRPEAATLVAFEDQEPLLAGLRRRRIIVDSPRMIADQERE